MNGTCQSCRFFSALDRECRRELQCTFVPDASGQIRPLGHFKPTKPEWWCGQYEAESVARNGEGVRALASLR